MNTVIQRTAYFLKNISENELLLSNFCSSAPVLFVVGVMTDSERRDIGGYLGLEVKNKVGF